MERLGWLLLEREADRLRGCEDPDWKAGVYAVPPSLWLLLAPLLLRRGGRVCRPGTALTSGVGSRGCSPILAPSLLAGICRGGC